MTSSQRFEDKIAFITGAASGIGRATAIAFASEGARVAVADRDEAALQETAEHVKAAGGEVVAITCDVSKPDEVAAAVARTVEIFGRIDCAFNNAGVENKAAPLAEIEIEEWVSEVIINGRYAPAVEKGGAVVAAAIAVTGRVKGGGVDDGAVQAGARDGYQVGSLQELLGRPPERRLAVVEAVHKGELETTALDKLSIQS